MKRHVSVAIWLGSVTIAVSAQAPQPKPQAGPLVDSSRLLVQIEQTPAGTTRVYGDPAQPGMYVSRVHLRPNAKTRPHYNDQDQIVTVLKGTWWVGKGEVFRQDRLVAVREGGLMYLPAKLAYYDVAGSGDVILQITGVGPVNSTHAELDAAGKAGTGRRSISRGHARRRRPAPPLRVSSSGCEQCGPRQSGPGAGDADTRAASGQSGPTAGKMEDPVHRNSSD